MRKTELEPEICTFCAELAGFLEHTNYSRLIGHTESRIIWKNDSFALIPSLGPVVEGHLLLIPTYHKLSFANLLRHDLLNAEYLIATISQFFKKKRQITLFFEHGAVILTNSDQEARLKKAMCRACTDHAHIHIIPNISAEPIIKAIENTHIHVAKHELRTLFEVRENVNPELPYICVKDSTMESWIAFSPEEVPNQFMRQIVASSVGLLDWDWFDYPRVQLVQRTVRYMGPKIKKWMDAKHKLVRSRKTTVG